MEEILQSLHFTTGQRVTFDTGTTQHGLQVVRNATNLVFYSSEPVDVRVQYEKFVLCVPSPRGLLKVRGMLSPVDTTLQTFMFTPVEIFLVQRRKFMRVPYFVPVTIYTQDGPVETSTLDLSAGGTRLVDKGQILQSEGSVLKKEQIVSRMRYVQEASLRVKLSQHNKRHLDLCVLGESVGEHYGLRFAFKNLPPKEEDRLCGITFAKQVALMPK